MPVLFLNESEVKGLLTMEMALEAVEAGFRKMALEEAFTIPRSRCQTDQTVLHVLSASAKTLGVLGLKAYTTNRRGTRFHVNLYDGKTGEMLALMQGDWLGRYRTGAASGVATKYLARPDAEVLSILGSGKQALTQALAVAGVRKLSEIRVFSPKSENREKFAAELREILKLNVVASASAEEAVRGSHIVCTITSSREPVLLGDWLSPGMHLNIAGSNFLGKTEIDMEVVKRSKPLVIDHKEQGQIEAGDFVEALNQQVLTWSEVTELGRIVANREPGREHPEQITLFKSLGIAVQDIALGIQVFQRAKAQNIGTWLEF
jgi:ornithine cyclodeaminase/alanine dehydrogenase-like protein (mu-crystallin family)